MNHRLPPARARRLAVLTLVGLVAGVAAVFGQASPASAATIASAGPLDRIEITPDLNCAVEHVADTEPEWFGDTACATLVAVGGTLYGPASIPAGSSAGPRTTFTPVSQTSGGSGTAADPFRIVTVVDAGTSGLRLTQTDTYVVGQEAYRTDVQVTNTGSSAVSAIVYRAGDCYLQNSDLGFGSYDAATGAITCVAGVDDGSGNTVPGTRIEQFFPLTPGSNYLEDFYDDVWSAVGTQQPLPNACADCAVYTDNGIALSWSLNLAAGASATVSHFTVFSPLGIAPLTTTKAADSASTAAGGTNGYTITVTNPNTTAATLDTVTDTLPAGFSYVAGSTTGDTTANPSVNGQTLTWSGPLSVPASGTMSFHFNVTVSQTPGQYLNQAGATSASFTVAPTGPTAPVTVTGVTPTNTPPTVAAGGPYNGTEGSPTSLDGTVTDPDAGDTVTTLWSYAAGPGVDAGATCSFAGATSVDTTVTCTDDGTYTLTLTANDGHGAVPSNATLTVANAAPVVTITTPADMSQHVVGATVSVSATVADPGANDTVASCTIDWGDGTVEAGTPGAGTCSGSHAYTAVGTPTITVTATDDDGASGSDEIGVVVVILDEATKVTGGGFTTTNGRTSFGFVARRGADGSMSGQIQIRLPGRVRFHGATVTTLESSANTAHWSGTGRYDGRDGYTFEVWVVDNGSGGGRRAGTDTIRLVIRDAAGATVADTGGPLQGGNLTVHR